MAENNIGNVQIGKVDATVQKKVAEKFNIKAFPTLILYNGERAWQVDYGGRRTLKDMIKFLEEEVTQDSAAGAGGGSAGAKGIKWAVGSVRKHAIASVILWESWMYDNVLMTLAGLWGSVAAFFVSTLVGCTCVNKIMPGAR